MERNNWVKVVSCFTILGALAALFVVPEFRKFVGLESKHILNQKHTLLEQHKRRRIILPLSSIPSTVTSTNQRYVETPSPVIQEPTPEPTITHSPIPSWPEKPNSDSTASGFTFELRQTRMLGGNVTFYLMITCHEENRSLGIGERGNNPAVMWDNLGNRYVAIRNTLANETNSYYPTRMVPALLTKATVTFDNVSSEATSVASVKIIFWTTWHGGGDWIGIEFRSVPLTK